MDALGDHATHCSRGYGITQRYNSLHNSLPRHVFKAAGLTYYLEVPFLIPNTQLRPTDILVQPVTHAPGLAPDHPTAYDVTVRSPFRRDALHHAARGAAGAAEQGDAHKAQDLKVTL